MTNKKERYPHMSKVELLKKFDTAVVAWYWWEQNQGPAWTKKVKRLLHFHYKYLFFGLSKIHPIRFAEKTFFGKRAVGFMPEHFYLFFGAFCLVEAEEIPRLISENKDADNFIFKQK